MKKLKSSLVNMVLVLTLIAILAGGLLAYINSITDPIIKTNKEKLTQESIKVVMGGGDIQVASKDTKDNFVVYSVNDTEGAPIGKAIETEENGFGGKLRVLVGFDNEGYITGYTVLEHQETPGLGAKAGLWFQKDGKGNIIGKNPGECKFEVSKDGGEIDAITASTITSRAFLKSIQNAYDKEFKKGGSSHE